MALKAWESAGPVLPYEAEAALDRERAISGLGADRREGCRPSGPVRRPALREARCPAAGPDFVANSMPASQRPADRRQPVYRMISDLPLARNPLHVEAS